MRTPYNERKLVIVGVNPKRKPPRLEATNVDRSRAERETSHVDAWIFVRNLMCGEFATSNILGL